MKARNVVVFLSCVALLSFTSCDETNNQESMGTIYDDRKPETITSEDYSYIEKDGNVYLTKYLGEETSELTIPNEVDGKSVYALGESIFIGNTSLEKVVISEGIKEIGHLAFHTCIELKDITLPDSLEKIGNATFYGCKEMDELEIPKSLQSVGTNTFEGTPYLEKIIEEDEDKFIVLENGYLMTYSGDEKDIVIPDDVKIIGTDVFFENLNIESVKIPDSVEQISEQAFCSAENLEKVEIGKSVKKVDKRAFFHCVALKEMTIPSNIEEIGDYAFGYSVGQKNYELVVGFSITAEEGSAAEQYCTDNAILFNKK